MDGLGSGCYGVGLKPGDLIRQFRKGKRPAAGYLLLGAEPFYRGRCRRALRDAVLGTDPDETAIVEIDLGEIPLTGLIEEARTMSLFSSDRLVIGRNAEQAVPGAASATSESEAKALADYFADPAPGTVVLVEAVKFDSRDRDEKAKLARVRKFYASTPVRVELESLSVQDARFVGQILAKRMQLRIGEQVLDELVDMLGADAFRIENELQKLALYMGSGREITREDIELLVPEARQSGVFELSQALADRDRSRAFSLLDTMSKSGMYWPMQLNLVAGLFRQALAAQELGLRDAQEIGSKLGSFGLRLWPGRTRQIAGIVARFREEELRKALIALFEADRSLRSSRPDDRLVVEMLVMKLTS